jgi:MFS family permease
MDKFRTPWRAVSAMFILNGGLFGIWASRVPAIVEKFDLSPERLGWLLFCIAGGAILAFPIAGYFSDKMGAAKFTKRIAVIYVVALWCLALSPTLPILAVSLLLFGATHGGMDVAMNAWAAEAEKRIGRSVMSSFHAMFSLGAGLGALSGYFAVNGDISIALHFTVTATILAAFTLTFSTIPWTSEQSTKGGGLFAIPKGALALVGLIALGASMGEGAMADWSAVFLNTVTNATEAQAALGYAVFSSAMVIARLFGGAIVTRFGPAQSARLSGAFAFCGVILAVLSGQMALTFIGFALMGLGYAAIFPLAFSRAASDPHIRPGLAIASVATLGYGGLLLGPPLIGMLAAATSLRLAFLVLALLAAQIILLARFLEVDS